ncbi:MAG: GNAT family N-acetyltransferase [Smithella sp.]|jgi:hypothetical protein
MNNSNISSKDQKYSISEATPEIDQEWCDFISERSDATIYHHPAWLMVLQNETKQPVLRLVCRDENARLVGVYPLQYTLGVPLGLGGILAAKRLSSLPRTPIGGPIAVNNVVEAMLVKKAIEISGKNGGGRLIQIKSYDHTLHETIPGLSRFFWREVYITKIPRAPKEIRFGNSKNHTAIKWAVNKALRHGIKVRYSHSDSDLIKWYDLYADTMRFHAVPARSINFFRGVWKYLMPLGLAQLILAEAGKEDETEIIAGNILFRYNKTIVDAFNGSKRETFELRPNDLLHWAAIHDAQTAGFEYYDLGEVADDHEGLSSYKKKWASETRSLYHFYYPEPDMPDKKSIGKRNGIGMKRKLWNLLPIKITTMIGERINEYL